MDTCHLQFGAKGCLPKQQYRIHFWGLVGPPCKSLPSKSLCKSPCKSLEQWTRPPGICFSCAIDYPADTVAEKRRKRLILLVARRGKAWSEKEGKRFLILDMSMI